MSLNATTRLGLFAICSIFGVLPRIASAQHTPSIAVDGSLKPAQPLSGPNYIISADLGKQIGGNLFHSFGRFSLQSSPVRESATFTSDGSTGKISNVIGRVTGGTVSSIDGLIRSTITGANLYLINPNGIVFGPNAKVDVSGSFHASTADYIKMSDGARFQATNPGGSILSCAPPAAFGFLTASPAAITVNGSTLGPVPSPPASAPAALGLVGGPVSITAASPTSITGATLLAPGGTIRVTSVAGAGEVPAVKGTRNKPTVANFGSVDITQGSTLDVSSGGSVFIRSGKLVISGGSQVNADNTGSGPGGRLVLHSDDNITLSGNTRIHANVAGSGKGAAISVKAGSLSIDSAQIGSTATGSSGDAGDISVNVAGALSIVGPNAFFSPGIQTRTQGTPEQGTGIAGDVTVRAGGVYLTNRVISSRANSAQISSLTFGSANSGSVHVNAGTLDLQNSSQISSSTSGSGTAGDVTVNATTTSIRNVSEINAATSGPGNAGTVKVSVTGNLSIVGPSSNNTSSSENIYTGIGTVTQESTGKAGSVYVSAGSLSIAGFLGEISSSTLGSGNAGDVSVDVAGPLSIAGPRGTFPTGIVAAAFNEGTGNAGTVLVKAGGRLSIGNLGEISATSAGIGAGGSVIVDAPQITVTSGAQIASTTAGTGKGGSVEVGMTTPGVLMLDGIGTQIAASTTGAQLGAGAGGAVMMKAGSLTVQNGAQITASSIGAGNAGSVIVDAPQIAVTSGAQIASTTAGTGKGGSVEVGMTTPGVLMLDGIGTQIAASTTGAQSGPGGNVTVSANSLTVQNGAQIAASTAGPGKGGTVTVNSQGPLSVTAGGGITASATSTASGNAGLVIVNAPQISVTSGAQIASTTAGTGMGGSVTVNSQGPLSLSESGVIIASATSMASGDAGSVMVDAPQISVTSGAQIASTTAGTGAGGSVAVTTPGALVLDGMGIIPTQIAASATGLQSGPGGPVTVNAGRLTIRGGAQIASSTAGPGNGGDVSVLVANEVSLSGVGSVGASGITTSAEPGSSGGAGQVQLMAGGAIALSGGAKVASSTDGTGKGGTVRVTANGPLSLSEPSSGIIASTSASGDAGSVAVRAPEITIAGGAQIASTTGGTGAGGSVDVTTPGALVLNGVGNASTQIAASATGAGSGSGGSVTVAANALTVEGGAQIGSSTAGPGKGGDINLVVAGDITLPDRGPQITAQSIGSGDAGSITVSAARVLMSNGGAISTEAATSMANGGNITLKVRDFLYLVSSQISTSVKGETGNGGNITIDPQLAILNHSSIIAQAIEGHGGNINITADQFIPSTDSIVSATSEKGISGTVVINGPRVDVNSALVVLSSELRGRAEVLREACAARGGRPISNLVEAGRGGLPQDPEATLPALYIAGRDINSNAPAAAGTARASGALQTRVHLTMRCG